MMPNSFLHANNSKCYLTNTYSSNPPPPPSLMKFLACTCMICIIRTVNAIQWLSNCDTANEQYFLYYTFGRCLSSFSGFCALFTSCLLEVAADGLCGRYFCLSHGQCCCIEPSIRTPVSIVHWRSSSEPRTSLAIFFHEQ